MNALQRFDGGMKFVMDGVDAPKPSAVSRVSPAERGNAASRGAAPRWVRFDRCR